ncbi:ORF252 [White spot syndrome virus]|uniref:ORF252 n=1 Tax=White spot syndrome virus TaxID=342409 RepID=A0A2D3I656_9VIRU|nr:ORF252 [White spot syndrome virus]
MRAQGFGDHHCSVLREGTRARVSERLASFFPDTRRGVHAVQVVAGRVGAQTPICSEPIRDQFWPNKRFRGKSPNPE